MQTSVSLFDDDADQFEIDLEKLQKIHKGATLKSFEDYMSEPYDDPVITDNEVITNMHTWTKEQIRRFFSERFRGHTVYSHNGLVINRNSIMKSAIKKPEAIIPGLMGADPKSWVQKPEPYNGSMGHPMGTYCLWSSPKIIPVVDRYSPPETKRIIAQYLWFSDITNPGT
jgi:hypothetical protein